MRKDADARNVRPPDKTKMRPGPPIGQGPIVGPGLQRGFRELAKYPIPHKAYNTRPASVPSGEPPTGHQGNK